MKIIKLSALLFTLLVVGCATKETTEAPKVTQEASYTGTGTLAIAPVIFAKDLKVRPAVRKECELLTKLPGFIQSFGQEQYAAINLEAQGAGAADFLKIEIIDLPRYKKNAWGGRRGGRGGQWVSVKGSLIRAGKSPVSFEASRASMGGFMGGYKGTCALLGRCIKTLGKDIAAWLKDPVDEAILGDM